MQYVLTQNSMWKYVNSKCLKPALGEVLTNFNVLTCKKRQKAVSDIILSISTSELKQARECESSCRM